MSKVEDFLVTLRSSQISLNQKYKYVFKDDDIDVDCFTEAATDTTVQPLISQTRKLLFVLKPRLISNLQ